MLFRRIGVGAVALSFLAVPAAAFAADWSGEYWNTPSAGSQPSFPPRSPDFTRTDAAIDFSWGTGSPNAAINNDHFMARWTKTENFAADTYHFTVSIDDGMRAYIDTVKVFDSWLDQGDANYTFDAVLSAGTHTIVVEYYENTGGAVAQFSYEGDSAGAPTVVTGSVSDIGQDIAYASGEVTDPGSNPVSYEGITWDTVSGSTYGDYTYATHASDPSTTPFTLPLYGLTCGTTYYYRAYAQNDDFGPYSVGDELSFTTLDCGSPPSIALGDSLYSGVFGPETWDPSVDWDISETCEYSYDSIDYFSANCSAGGTDIPPPDTDGSPTLFLRGSNGSGESETAIGFIYDSVAPTVSIATPLSGATIRASDWAGPQVDWDDAVTCEYSYDDATYYDAGGCGYDTLISMPVYGPATLYVRGTDDAGNAGTDSISFTYEADVYGCMDPGAENYDSDANIDDASCTYPDLVAPSVSFNSPYEGELVGAFSASVNWDDATSCSYEYDSSGPVPMTCGDDGSIDPPTPGEHTLTVYGADDSANEGSASVTFTYSPAPLFAEDNGAVESVSENAAIVDYSMSTQGSTIVTRIDLVYDTDAAYTGSGGLYGQSVVFEAGGFADSGGMNLESLSCGTQYHFAFVAYNMDYTATSSDSTFTTSDCPAPSVTIGTPGDGDAIRTWWPEIDWGISTTCEYAIDSGSWTAVACEAEPAIPEPTEDSHTLDVRGSTDDGATWVSASASFSYDKTPPTVTIIAPTSGATVSESGFTAEVDWGDSVACSYSYDGFGNEFPRDCSRGGADIPVSPAGGETTLSVKGRDSAGNRTEASVDFTFVEDSGAPTVSLTSPLNGSTHLKGELLTLSADASDDGDIEDVRFYVNGVAIYPDTSAPYSFDWNTAATSSGTKTVVAVAKDAAGNYATSSSATFTLKNFEGSGTSGDPYQIEECFQFATMNDFLDASYILTQDLDCTGIGSNVMVGEPDIPFTGAFDGDGHLLVVNISESDEDKVGLFRETDGATIRDIRIIGQVAGAGMTGTLIGLATNTTVISASTTALVVGLGGFVSPPYLGTGGIVGAMVGGSVLGSSYGGQMLGYVAVGGIAGTASSDALISRSYSTGEIYAGVGGGGIAGYLLQSQVRNSYSTGSVIFYEPLRDGLPVSGSFGGIAGIILQATISRSYSTGDVGGSDLLYPSGGIAGVGQGDNLIAYSFSASDMIGTDTDAGAFLGGSLDDLVVLRENSFDRTAAGTSICRADQPEDFEGCTAVDTGGDAGYWKYAAHAPLGVFDTSTVWNFSSAGNYPVLRAYLGAEAAESDEPGLIADPAPDDSEDDADPEPARAVSYGGGGAAGLFGSVGTFKGPGYIAPRAQIIFPDGRVVYLDEQQNTPSSPTVSTANATTYAFTRSLKLGMSGEDVRQLQIYLNTHGFVITAQGPGSPGNETTYFGALTKAALIRFQEAHASEILAPVGLRAGTGLFGPSTIAFLSRTLAAL